MRPSGERDAGFGRSAGRREHSALLVGKEQERGEANPVRRSRRIRPGSAPRRRGAVADLRFRPVEVRSLDPPRTQHGNG